jgi:hypothetical protein
VCVFIKKWIGRFRAGMSRKDMSDYIIKYACANRSDKQKKAHYKLSHLATAISDHDVIQ